MLAGFPIKTVQDRDLGKMPAVMFSVGRINDERSEGRRVQLPAGVFYLQADNHGPKEMIPALVEEIFC